MKNQMKNRKLNPVTAIRRGVTNTFTLRGDREARERQPHYLVDPRQSRYGDFPDPREKKTRRLPSIPAPTFMKILDPTVPASEVRPASPQEGRRRRLGALVAGGLALVGTVAVVEGRINAMTDVPEGDNTYVVKPGDSPSEIAEKYTDTGVQLLSDRIAADLNSDGTPGVMPGDVVTGLPEPIESREHATGQ